MKRAAGRRTSASSCGLRVTNYAFKKSSNRCQIKCSNKLHPGELVKRGAGCGAEEFSQALERAPSGSVRRKEREPAW